jgi:hypothetical protein
LARLYQPPAFLPFSMAKSRPAVQFGLEKEIADLLEETSNPREAGFSRGATAAVTRRWRRNARKIDKISQRGEKAIKQYALDGSLRQRSSRVISDLEFEIDMIRIVRTKFFDALINKVSP